MGTGRAIAILADDLSGACETAAAVGRFPVYLTDFTTGKSQQNQVKSCGYAVDLGTRELPVAVHRSRLMRELHSAGPDALIFVKTDSLLRGPVRETLVTVASLGRPVLYSPVLPDQGRLIVDGKLLVHGVPLHETDLWLREPVPAPTSIRSLLHRVPHRMVDGRLSADDLIAGVVTVCSFENPDQAQRIMEIALATDAVLVGSSALAKSLSPYTRDVLSPAVFEPGERRILIVIGSAASEVHEQARKLADQRGMPIRRMRAAQDKDWLAAEMFRGSNVELLMFERADRYEAAMGPVMLGQASRLVAELDRAEQLDLIAIGGETARTVLSVLGVGRLDVSEEIQRAAILSSADGRAVVVRPGTFGDENSLIEILEALENVRA